MTLLEFLQVSDSEIRLQVARVVGGEWFASVLHLDIMGDGVLSSCCGRGPTTSTALADLVRKLSCKRVVVDAGLPSRREFSLPTLVL